MIMTTPFAKLLSRTLPVAALVGLLAACAPPPTTPVAGNLNLEVRRLQSALDRQEQTVDSLSRQVAELENRLQRQTEELEQLRPSPHRPQSADPQYGTAPSQESIAAAIRGEGTATEVYLQAFGDYASGRYHEAIRGFESFLQRFPTNSYASNAQFWLGDCYFNQQQYARAVEEFEKVIAGYPNASKNPDALLKIAIAQLQLGDTDKARQAVDRLSRRYPKSTAMQKAQELTIP